jgi:isocitrate dehydrogenase
MKAHKVTIVDKNNVRWVFEGRIDGIPIYVKEEEAFPKMMTWKEALNEYEQHNNDEELIKITEVNY